MSDAHSQALHDLLMYPAASVAILARKLVVFRDEEMCDCVRADELIAVFAADARRLVNSSREA